MISVAECFLSLQFLRLIKQVPVLEPVPVSYTHSDAADE